ncbi:PSP1 C-terminal conserved region-domain-containing protein [Umbelopsis sp. PMI_123]|nr:PSP1 C-terminal conserved region-domain-containing protein [Umbelopsis sp. PMI_123]
MFEPSQHQTSSAWQNLSRSSDHSNNWNMTANGDDSSSAGGKTDIFSESSSISPPNTPGPSAAVPPINYIGEQNWSSFLSTSQKSPFDLPSPDNQYEPKISNLTQQRRTSVENIWNTGSQQPKSASIWSEGLPKQGLTPVLQDSAFSKDPPFRTYRSFSQAVPNSAKREPMYQNSLPMTSEENEAEFNNGPARSMSAGAVIGGVLDYPKSSPNTIWSPVPHVQRDSRLGDMYPNFTQQPAYFDNGSMDPLRRFSTVSENLEMYKPAPNFIHSAYAIAANLRRHSVAGTLTKGPKEIDSMRQSFNDLGLEENAIPFPSAANPNAMMAPSQHDMAAIHEYFDDRRTTQQEMGKGIPLHQVQGALYTVEFKGSRSDLYYVSESDALSGLHPQCGDLVIVEADRGKDLGTVVAENVSKDSVDVSGSKPGSTREMYPKRIYRLAQPQEISLLAVKKQDEEKALFLCQSKIARLNLPMEVVSAEYQWDRRKLTFYFIADRRIDFRDLVRDLFKTYKTRIWMCAMKPVGDSSEP